MKIFSILLVIFSILLLSWCSSSDSSNLAQDKQDVAEKEVNTWDTDYTWYTKYNSSEVTKNEFESVTSILFFYKQDCASCESMNNDITSNIQQIPEQVEIFKVDMEVNQPLLEKYSIDAENSFVVLHSKGNSTKISWLTTLESLLSVSESPTIQIIPSS